MWRGEAARRFLLQTIKGRPSVVVQNLHQDKDGCPESGHTQDHTTVLPMQQNKKHDRVFPNAIGQTFEGRQQVQAVRKTESNLWPRESATNPGKKESGGRQR